MQTQNLQLDESRLKKFLHKDSGLSQPLVEYLCQLPKKLNFPVTSLLDCGGGNGMILDLLLDVFADSQGTLLDSSQFMLDQNKLHSRKTLCLGNLEDFSMVFNDAEKKFDVIVFSDVLHHCVLPSYRETRQLQLNILKNAAKFLSPNGVILIVEFIYESWLTNEFSTKWIYHLTSSKKLQKIIHYLGANTAGVGVCYTSHRVLSNLCCEAGLKTVEISPVSKYSINSFSRAIKWGLGLGIKSIIHTCYLLNRFEK